MSGQGRAAPQSDNATIAVATIMGLGQFGEGVAEIDGARVFVPFTAPGDTVEIAIEGNRGKVLSMVAASPVRTTPFCPHFGRCGGCQLQHLGAPAYADFKRGVVRRALEHAGIAVEIGDLVDARGNGRRRATLHARREGAGFMGLHSHQLENLDLCPILVPALAAAPGIARGLRAALGDCEVAITATLTGLDVSVRAARKARPEKLAPLAQRHRLARLSIGDEPVLQQQAPVVRMGRALVELPPQSFLQATAAAEMVLADHVATALEGCREIADLFCGLGPFALRLAETARIAAYDSDKGAIVALTRAHNTTKGLKAIAAQRRDLFRESLTAVELKRFDGVVFDPPRAGAEAQARELARSSVPTVVAVSCEPKTFARDAALLIAGGYRLESVVPIDQFAYSTHVEVVGVFRK